MSHSPPPPPIGHLMGIVLGRGGTEDSGVARVPSEDSAAPIVGNLITSDRIVKLYVAMCQIASDLLSFSGEWITVSAPQVKSPNKGHVGDVPFVPCREVVLFSF